MLVLGALSFSVVLIFAALAIDVGFFLHTRTKLQADADAMALAGVQELPDTTSAHGIARDWGTKNGVQSGEVDSIVFGTTCSGNSTPDTIAVQLTRRQPTFLAKIMGITEADIAACATAVLQGAGDYAVFAYEPSCHPDNQDALQRSGSETTVTGGLHSNSYFHWSGSDNTITESAEYDCDIHLSGQNNTAGSGPYDAGFKDWPLYFTGDDLLPYCTPALSDLTGRKLDITTSDDRFWLNDDPSTNTLETGVYCSKGDLTLSGSDITGNVTFIAKKELKVSGSDFTLLGYLECGDDPVGCYAGADHKLLLVSFSTIPSNSLHMSGSGGLWDGIMFAPFGRADISGSSNFSIVGRVLGNEVKLSGSNFGITYSGNSSSYFSKLIE